MESFHNRWLLVCLKHNILWKYIDFRECILETSFLPQHWTVRWSEEPAGPEAEQLPAQLGISGFQVPRTS